VLVIGRAMEVGCLYVAEPGESLFGEAIIGAVLCDVLDERWEDGLKFLTSYRHGGRVGEERGVDESPYGRNQSRTLLFSMSP
jgi:hypothetical protein